MSKSLEGNIIKKAHEKVPYTKEQYEQFLMCIPEHNKDAHHYFMTNFGYLKHPKHGKQLYVPYDYQIKLIDNFHNYRFNINMLGRQMGKALSGNTEVLTNNGVTKLSDIKVGDYVCNRSGEFTKVLFKTEPQYNRKCYKIHFDTGEYIIADENHEWLIYDVDNGKESIKTTKDILDKFYNYKIPTTNKIDINIPELSKYLNLNENNSFRNRRNILNTIIYKYSVFDNGFYKVISTDTDFLMNVQLLVSSIGIKCILERDSVRFSIRKYEAIDDKQDFIYITKIEEADSEPVYCIEVDNAENTFLVGRSLITTHNCVVGDTRIKIKNKITGELMEVTIKDFHELIKRDF
jgi:hypothetical protein